MKADTSDGATRHRPLVRRERHEEKVARTIRLFSILKILSSGASFNAPQLAEHCRVSTRTIFRDIATLRLAGIEIAHSNARQAFHFRDEQIQAVPRLTRDEMLAAVLSCRAIGDRRYGVPCQGLADSAALKLIAHARTRFGDEFLRLTETITMRLTRSDETQCNRALYRAFTSALQRRRRVRIRYRDKHRSIRTALAPYRLVFYGCTWLIVGRSSVHRATQTFDLSRITEFQILDDCFEMPSRFDLDRHLRAAARLER